MAKNIQLDHYQAGKIVLDMKVGKLKSGWSGKRIQSRKQTSALGLSEHRKRPAKDLYGED